MAWVLKVSGNGVEETAPPRVHAARRLIYNALEAINKGEQYTGMDHEHRVAAMAVYIGDAPVSIRFGHILPVMDADVRAYTNELGAQGVTGEIHWSYDIPIRQE